MVKSAANVRDWWKVPLLSSVLSKLQTLPLLLLLSLCPYRHFYIHIQKLQRTTYAKNLFCENREEITQRKFFTPQNDSKAFKTYVTVRNESTVLTHIPKKASFCQLNGAPKDAFHSTPRKNQLHSYTLKKLAPKNINHLLTWKRAFNSRWDERLWNGRAQLTSSGTAILWDRASLWGKCSRLLESDPDN